MSTMTLAEAMELLRECTGLAFVQNELKAQLEVDVGTWRITIADFTKSLDANAKATKAFCVLLLSNTTGWVTGQRFVVFSAQQGLWLLSDWINGFLKTWEAKSETD